MTQSQKIGHHLNFCPGFCAIFASRRNRKKNIGRLVDEIPESGGTIHELYNPENKLQYYLIFPENKNSDSVQDIHINRICTMSSGFTI